MRSCRPALTNSLLVALPLACLAAASPAHGRDTCEFQSHQVEPARPAPGQPFIVTVRFIASCYAFYPPVVEGDRVIVGVVCSCPIDPSPPPTLWEHSFEIPGLSAGTAVVELRNQYPPKNLLYRFALVIGTLLDIPALGAVGALLLAALLLVSAFTLLGRRGGVPPNRL